MKFEKISVSEGNAPGEKAALSSGFSPQNLIFFVESAKAIAPYLKDNTGVAVVKVDGRFKVIGVRLSDQEVQDDHEGGV